MDRPFKGAKFVTLDLLLVIILVLVAAAVLIPWGLQSRSEEKVSEESAYHQRRVLLSFGDGADHEQVIKAWGGEITRRFEPIGVYEVRTPSGIFAPQAVESLLALSGVARVEPDYKSPVTESPEPSRAGGRWGFEKVNAATAWSYTLGTRDVVLAVLDTGLDTQHSKVIYRTIQGHSVLKSPEESPIPYHDLHGRGTHLTAIAGGAGPLQMTGLAQNVRLLPIQTHNEQGQHYRSDLIAGLLWLALWAEDNPERRIVALIQGGWKYESEFLHQAVNLLQEKGVLLICGAGDLGSTEKIYPAAIEGVMAVGAIDAQDRKTATSNYGDWVNLAAPGDDIYSAMPGGGYGFASGTDQAAAFVAGAAALVWSLNNSLTVNEVQDILLASARSVEEGAIKWKILDAGKALELTSELD